MIRAGLLEQINTRPASPEADALSLLPEDVRNVLSQVFGTKKVLAEVKHKLEAIDAEIMCLGGFSGSVHPIHVERVEHLFEEREWTRTDFDVLNDFYHTLTHTLSVMREGQTEDKKENEPATA